MRRFAACVALTLLVALTYRDAPDNGFHFDDELNITLHAPVHVDELSLATVIDAARGARLANRPVAAVSFAFDWWRGGGSARAFQWTNIALHMINACLVFALLLRLCAPSGASERSGRAVIAALIGAAFWAVHPIQVQAVTYVVQRMTELAALFTLASVLLYLAARSRSGALRIVGMLASAACMALGMLCKENAIVAPALIVLCELALYSGTAPLFSRPRDYVLIAPFAFIVGVLALSLYFDYGALAAWIQQGYETRDFGLAERLLTQPRVIVYNASQILLPLPHRFALLHSVTPSESLLEPASTLPALIAVCAWCVGGLWLLIRAHTRVVGLFVLWVPAALAVESSVLALEMLFEHRWYLPLVGIAGLLGLAMQKLLERTRMRSVAALAASLALIAALSASATQRVRVWRDDVTLYRDSLAHSADSWRTQYNLALALHRARSIDSAVDHYRRSLELNEQNPLAYANLGHALRERADHGAAITAYDRAIGLDPKRGEYYLGRALSQRALGRTQPALRDFERAAKTRLEDTTLYLAYGDLLIEQGEIDTAVSVLARGATTLAADAQLRNAHGRALAMAMRLRDAEREFRAALRLDAGLTDARANLGGVLIALGELDQAAIELQRALESDPRNGAALNNLRVLEGIRERR